MATARATRMLNAFRRQNLTETVIYRPVGGRPREITVLVDRPGHRDMMHARAAAWEVMAVNDDGIGISSVRLDVGADQVDVAERFGGTRTPRSIQKILEQDADWVVLAIQ